MSKNDNSNELKSGSSLSYSQIIEKIGSGGMEEVYLALDTKLNRKVALKVLLNDYFDNIEKI